MLNFDQGGRLKKKKKNPIKSINNLIKTLIIKIHHHHDIVQKPNIIVRKKSCMDHMIQRINKHAPIMTISPNTQIIVHRTTKHKKEENVMIYDA